MSIIAIAYSYDFLNKYSISYSILTFRLNVPPKGNAYSEMFLNAKPGSVMAQILEKSMHSESYMPIEQGLQTILDKPKQSYFYLYDIIL